MKSADSNLNRRLKMGDAIPESTAKYLEPLPEDQRKALLELRDWIIAAAPDAKESLNYGVPAFKLGGKPLVSLGAAKKHCAFYVQSPAVSHAFSARLDGLDTSPGTVRLHARQAAAPATGGGPDRRPHCREQSAGSGEEEIAPARRPWPAPIRSEHWPTSPMAKRYS
jgi:uncharacterized protein YdhG (YjbR/CyaY superfamily)